VLFEKAGYVSVNKPVTLSGATEEPVSVVLEKADAVAVAPPGDVKVEDKPPGNLIKLPGDNRKPPRDRIRKPPGDGAEIKPPVDKPPVDKPPVDKPPVDKPPVDKPPVETKGEGVLAIASKPPCAIYVDSKDTGLKTPQRELKLSAGKHKITLANNEFSIKETFWVEIKPGETTKAAKNFMDKIPAP
jgi:hypothetical protein